MALFAITIVSYSCLILKSPYTYLLGTKGSKRGGPRTGG